MKAIRIILGCNEPALHDALARECDMQIVGQVVRPLELLVAVHDLEADVVVLELFDGRAPGVCSHLLQQYPDLTVLGIGERTGEAVIQQLCPSHARIDAASPEALVAALRRAVREPCLHAGLGAH